MGYSPWGRKQLDMTGRLHFIPCFGLWFTSYLGLPYSSNSKESACNAGDLQVSWVRKILWRREWQSTPVFLPGESHGQGSLVGYSPWDSKESDTTEQLTLLLSGTFQFLIS